MNLLASFSFTSDLATKDGISYRDSVKILRLKFLILCKCGGPYQHLDTTVKPGVSKLFLVNNLALVNIFCFPKSHFQHKSPIDSKQPGVSKLFAA